MSRTSLRSHLAVLVTALMMTTAVGMVSATNAAAHDRKDRGNTSESARLYVPPPNDGALRQIVKLLRDGKFGQALMISKMVATPQAVWFTQGTPKDVRRDVRQTVRRAAATHTVPVLVAYNIPFRDCAQFSAGGATTVEEYEAWIDAFASGIGAKDAIVILEPDGLGIIPWYDPFGSADGSNTLEWCQPAEADAATAAAERFEMLNYAVDALKAHPNVTVYLDGTHSAWLGSGDAAHRLVQAGVQRADGFYLNASNYRLTEHLEKYGTWTAKCVWYATNPAEGGWRLGHFEWCASQYFPADPNDFSTWPLTDQWYADNVDNAATPPTSAADLPHFVVDTSRNGQGHWTPPASAYPDPQDWCNPPSRGLGLRPTTDTGNPLIDAYLWVKIPGESDGECTRGLGPAGSTVDPEWGLVDPAAGEWFPEMALDLASNAVPALDLGWGWRH